jgi:hypothetical protein
MPMYEGLPALLYTAFWSMKIDGRLKERSMGRKFTLLIDFDDYPPAFSITIKDGDFKIDLYDNREHLSNVSRDAMVAGKFQDIVEITDGLGSIVKALLQRKILVKGKRHLIKLLKMINVKHLKGQFSSPSALNATINSNGGGTEQ